MNNLLPDNILECLPVGVLIFEQKNGDEHLICYYANTAAAKLLNVLNLKETAWATYFPFSKTVADTVFFYENSQKWLKADVKTGDTEGSLIVTLSDVTTLAQMEQQLDVLRKSNTDLEHFAYVASHDLREPLRKISAFGERLQKKYANSLDSDGTLYLDRITNATHRMQTLIDDLLMFSRLVHDDTGFKSVDLNEIIGNVVANSDCPEDVKIDCDEMPTIHANPTQMTQLFQNLVSNALKFRQPDTLPKIHIGCKNVNVSTCEITVTDDGIGFEDADAERIFTLFHRLNGRSEYEGTGIGLAICKKIVESHNGTIVAKGTPNGGAVFTIRLPLNRTDQ